jgi:hypothetical protein
VPEPRYADAPANARGIDPRPDGVDNADDLMPWHEWQFRMLQFAVDDMEIRPAHRASLDFEPYLAWPGDRVGALDQDQLCSRSFQDHRFHRDLRHMTRKNVRRKQCLRLTGRRLGVSHHPTEM